MLSYVFFIISLCLFCVFSFWWELICFLLFVLFIVVSSISFIDFFLYTKFWLGGWLPFGWLIYFSNLN